MAQKIIPYLWFDDNAEEAAEFYTSIFNNSKIGDIGRYNAESAEIADRPEGSVMVIEFTIEGVEFVGLNGGPLFKFNPSVSFMVNFDPSREDNAFDRINTVWNKLAEGGKVLMPIDKYDFSERYGWIQDKYGVSWQLILTNPDGEERPAIIPSLLFTEEVLGKAEEALQLYVNLFNDSQVGGIHRYPTGMEPDKEGTVMFADFMLEGQWFAAMDSAREHGYTFNEAISLLVKTENQAETDKLWSELTRGGEEQPCGWLKDKYGFSWQITPAEILEIMKSKDSAKTNRAMSAVFKMKKLEIAKVKEAAEGVKVRV